MKISGNGTMMQSRQFDILRHGDTKKVLGCMRYLLELAANRSPVHISEKNDEEKQCADESDYILDLDNNAFLDSPFSADDGA
jgi:hypothetical protein